jgi:hypothetical protein
MRVSVLIFSLLVRPSRSAKVSCVALIRGDTRFHQEAGQPEPLDEIFSGLV